MKKLFIFLSSVFTFLIFAFPAIAQDANKLMQEDGTKHACLYKGVPTMDCFLPLFANIIYWLIILAGTVAIFFVILGGIKLLTSSGMPEKVTSARNTIMWSIIGLVVVLLSFMIVNVIGDLTGVNCISRIGFTQCGGVGNLKACSGKHPTGYCTNADKTCVFIDSGRYACELLCDNKSKKDGWCYSGKCTKTSTIPPTWSCR